MAGASDVFDLFSSLGLCQNLSTRTPKNDLCSLVSMPHPNFWICFLARNRFLPSRGPSRTFGSFEGPVCQRRQIKKCTIRKTQQTPLCPRILCRTPIFWGCPFSVIFSSNIPWNFYVQGWKMTPQAYVFMGQIQLAENDFAIFRTHVCIHS